MTGRLGGFHFNDSKYGDDDLTVGSIHPYQLFLVMLELLEHGGGAMPPLAYMIDQSNNLKDPIEDLIQATDAIQHTLALGALRRPCNRSPPRRRQTTRRWRPRFCRRRTAPTSARSSPKRAGGTAPRSIPLTAYRRSGYREAVDRCARLRARRDRALACASRPSTWARPPSAWPWSISTRRRPGSRSYTGGCTARRHVRTARCGGAGRSSWTNVRLGLDRALETGPIASIGIDGWGVDYGLLDERRTAAFRPAQLQSPRTDGWRDLARSLGEAELYRRTGIQLMPINTIFQLAVHDRDELDRAARLLMLPELVAYELTGEAVSERSNAGTTGLLDVATGDWASDLAEAVGVAPAILPTVERAGRLLGEHRGVPVHLVAAHDTACAVAASPLGPADRGVPLRGHVVPRRHRAHEARCVRDRSRGQLLERAWRSRRLSVSEKRAGLLAPGALRIASGATRP